MPPSAPAAAVSLRILLALCIAVTVTIADMYDVLMPRYTPPASCSEGCAEWSTHRASLWQADAVPPGAGRSCAMLAKLVGGWHTTGAQSHPNTSFGGPWCYCASTSAAVECVAPQATPEQINLQLAEPTVVVASFITYDAEAPTSPPQAKLSVHGEGKPSKLLQGVFHRYSDPANSRVYTMNFVRFTGLSPRANYTYQVRGGGTDGPWSDTFTFRAPYASGPTRIGIYGDMGHSLHNNMGNLQADCSTGKIDAIVHMGDHAYDLGMAHDSHGDAYMNAFQPTLANCPWLPGIGNHESYLGPGSDRTGNFSPGITGVPRYVPVQDKVPVSIQQRSTCS